MSESDTTQNTRAWLEKPPLVNQLAARYPQLTRQEAETLAQIIIQELEDGVAEGRHLALVKRTPKGSLELDLLTIDTLAEQVSSQKDAR